MSGLLKPLRRAAAHFSVGTQKSIADIKCDIFNRVCTIETQLCSTGRAASLVLSLFRFLCVICTNALQNKRGGQIKGLSSSVSFLRKFPEVHLQGGQKAHDNCLPKYSSSLQQFAAWGLPEPEVMSMFLVILQGFFSTNVSLYLI